MDKDMFEELMASVHQMDEIVKGKEKASRIFDFPAPQVKEIRECLGVSQEYSP